MPECCRSPGNSLDLLFSVQPKTVYELWLYRGKRGNTRGNDPPIKNSPLTVMSNTFFSYFFKGPALCGKAKHFCEWHHQLRPLPLHPRHLSAHRCRFPEEPAGHAAVSGNSSWGESVPGKACEYRYFISFGCLPLFFLPFRSPLLHNFCFLTYSSVIHTMGKLVHLSCTV